MEVSWGVKSACIITFVGGWKITQQKTVVWCKEAFVNARKRNPAMSICRKCNNTVYEEKRTHSPSFLSLSGTALEMDGDAAVDGGEAGFSVSMFASRL